MAFAFRCKNCGRIETSANAGERAFPAACPICGHGVHYDPVTGLRTYEDGENWEVLADLPAADKKALADDHGVPVDELIETHVPATPDTNPDHEPTEIARTASETLGQEDKPGATLAPAPEPEVPA